MSMAQPHDLLNVLARLEEATPDEVDSLNRRRFKRYSVRDDAKLEPMDDDGLEEPLPILLRDISRGGLGFLTDRFIEPNSMWRVRFLSHGHVAGSQPMIVRFCRLVQDNLYIAGGQFVIEPFIMHELGISESRLQAENLREYSDQDISQFLGPDEV